MLSRTPDAFNPSKPGSASLSPFESSLISLQRASWSLFWLTPTRQCVTIPKILQIQMSKIEDVSPRCDSNNYNYNSNRCDSRRCSHLAKLSRQFRYLYFPSYIPSLPKPAQPSPTYGCWVCKPLCAKHLWHLWNWSIKNLPFRKCLCRTLENCYGLYMKNIGQCQLWLITISQENMSGKHPRMSFLTVNVQIWRAETKVVCKTVKPSAWRSQDAQLSTTTAIPHIAYWEAVICLLFLQAQMYIHHMTATGILPQKVAKTLQELLMLSSITLNC